MGVKKVLLVVEPLMKYWRKQNIDIIPKSVSDIEIWMSEKGIFLPGDFKELYSKANGMKNFYPNRMDEEGFLFYPIDSIISVKDEFENSELINNNRVYIFAEYMHKSWWYGLEIMGNNNYTIGIIPDKDTFKPISNSLIEFIELYIENSSKLYDYS